MVYPPGLQRAGIAGSVMVTFILDTMGRAEPRSLRVRNATDPGFIDAAFDLVLGSRYRPARLKIPPRKALRVLINQPVNFKLRRRAR